MNDVVEAPFDVALDEPDRPLPRIPNFPKSRVATSFRPEPMGMDAEPLFVIWFQQRPQNLHHELVAPCWDAQRPHLPVRLRDLRPTNRRPLVSLASQQGDDVMDL